MPLNVAPQDEQCVVLEFDMGMEGDNGDIGVLVGDLSKPPTVSSSEALVKVQDVRLVGEELVLVRMVLEVGEVGETDDVVFGRMTASTLALGQSFVEDEIP